MKYQPSHEDSDTNALVERLGDAGCDDTLVGIGQPGRLALEFTREAADAGAAVRSALADVHRTAPSARLIEMTPDLLELTDVAEIVGVSRQNMRKLMLAHPESFPVPVHVGSASIWQLAGRAERRTAETEEVPHRRQSRAAGRRGCSSTHKLCPPSLTRYSPCCTP